MSHCCLAPGARVFATRGLRDRKTPANPVGVKKVFSQIKAEKKNLRPFQNGHSKSPVRKARTWTRPQPNHLILAISQWRTQKESPTSRGFVHWRCGPILTRIDAYENQHLGLFDHGRTKKENGVSGFLFRPEDRKRKLKPIFRLGSTLAG